MQDLLPRCMEEQFEKTVFCLSTNILQTSKQSGLLIFHIL